MALNYATCAKEIYETLGGRENLVSAAHCATRLRLVTVDNSKVDLNALENIDGVKGVFESNGQLQLIIGTGTVNKVYDEFLAVSGMSAATKDEVKAAAAAKQPVFKRMIKAMGDVFVPILPAIVASGLMMGLVEALAKAIPSFGGSDWFAVLDLFANTAFVFLPVLIATSAARVFGGNMFLGAVIGMIMIHPNLINAWSVGGLAEIPVWTLFNIGDFAITINQVGYQGHVIPVIIAVWMMSKIEGWLHKKVPEMIDLFVTPLATVLATAFITLIVIGPIFSTAETYILNFASWIVTVGYGIGATIMGAVYPLTVVSGIHHMYNVIEAGMLAAEDGLNIWMPIASAANFAQGAACLAVGLKARNAKTKAIAIPSALSAALGITEPAIFGINLRMVKPLLCGIAGGAAGSLVGALLHVGAKGYGVTGIPGYLITMDYALQYTLLLAVSFAVAFGLTWIVWHEEDGKKAKKNTKSDDVSVASEPKTVYAPMNGNVIARENIPDATFAQGVLGDGVGIEPTEGVVYAPFDGEISTVAETKHAVGISGNNDMEMLIHVGIDTVKMNGEGFNVLVAEGDQVKAGQKLMTFSLDKIKAAGFSTTTAVLLTNSDDYEGFKVVKTGAAKAGEKIITV